MELRVLQTTLVTESMTNQSKYFCEMNITVLQVEILCGPADETLTQTSAV